MRPHKLRGRRWAESLGAALLLAFASGLLFGALGVIAALLVAMLVIAVRHDNDLGYCLPLAILVLLILGVLTLLLVLMSIAHR